MLGKVIFRQPLRVEITPEIRRLKEHIVEVSLPR